MSADGTSQLTEEQQEFYRRRYGVNYVAVQWQPGVMSRADRRQQQFRPRSERPAKLRRHKH